MIRLPPPIESAKIMFTILLLMLLTFSNFLKFFFSGLGWTSLATASLARYHLLSFTRGRLEASLRLLLQTSCCVTSHSQRPFLY